MGRADRVLYASVRRLVRRFEVHHVPLTGVAGTQLTWWGLRPAAAAADAFRRPGAVGFEEGVRLLPRLEAQLAALRNAEEDTVQALAEWCALAEGWGRRGVRQPFAAAAAAEEGMALLSAQVALLTDPLQLGDADGGDDGDDDGQAPASLDSLADAARRRHLGVFADAGAEASAQLPSGQQGAERLHALSEVLYSSEFKLRCTPFEWVYDGLKPLLLPDVLRRRKAAPAAAAVAAAAVGRRLGVPLLPLPAEPVEAGAEGGIAGAIPTEHLPPDLAQKFANRAQALAPGPGAWLLRLDSNASVDAPRAGALALDAGTGAVLSEADAARRYPATAALSADAWRERSVLATWQGLARLALQAHQRRGESDLVAHWLYVAIALDPGAPEWGRVLSGPELA